MPDAAGVNQELQPKQTRRLFFAVELSDDVRQAIADLAQRLQKAAHFTPIRASWVRPENYHLTLYFLGEVNEDKAQALSRAMADQTATARAFTLDVRHVGTFPDPKKGPPRVLWMSVWNPAPELLALRQRCSQALQQARLPVPVQDFSPHVTIARFKSTRGVFAFTKMLKDYEFAKAGKCPVTRLVLMESHTGGGEARYAPYATAPLAVPEPLAPQGPPPQPPQP